MPMWEIQSQQEKKLGGKKKKKKYEVKHKVFADHMDLAESKVCDSRISF